MDIFIIYLNFSAKHHDKCKFTLKFILLVTIPNLFSLQVVRKCQNCQLCVLQENSNACIISDQLWSQPIFGSNVLALLRNLINLIRVIWWPSCRPFGRPTDFVKMDFSDKSLLEFTRHNSKSSQYIFWWHCSLISRDSNKNIRSHEPKYRMYSYWVIY